MHVNAYVTQIPPKKYMDTLTYHIRIGLTLIKAGIQSLNILFKTKR